MSGENYTNTASVATTAAPIGPSDLTVTVASFSGWPSVPFWAWVENGTPSAELVRVTNVAGSVLTITRGQGGTAATSHGAGVEFDHRVPASHFNETEAHMLATSAHGVGGNIVGTSGAQTVQDKKFEGAFKSEHSDVLPVGITASYESVADTAGARDGFVHRNTAGHADRRGFLLQQSGTDRVQVFNDGTTDLTPGASARPGLRNRGTSQLDGNVTAGAALAVTGASSLNGGVAVTGTASVTGTSTLAAVNATNVSASGTIHANGSIDTDTNLVVDGTSTLTGTVTAGGAVNAGSVAATAAVTGASATFTNQVNSYGGRVVPSVTSFPSSPVDGQLVYRSDLVMLYRYNISITDWSRMLPHVPRAELRQAVAQGPLANSVWTDIVFDTEDLDTHNGHAASATSYIVPAGWTGKLRLMGGVGFAASTGSARGVRWAKNSVAIARSATLLPNDSGNNIVVPAKTLIEAVVPGDVITLQGWHNTVSAVNTSVVAENQSYMSVEWMLT